MLHLSLIPALRTAVAAAVALTTAVALSGAAVAAPPVFNDHFVFTETHIEQEAHEDFCPDIPFLVEFTGHVTITERLLVRGVEGPEYFSFRITSQETFTNLETGRTMTILNHFQDGDHRVVDNGDGTLTIEVAGHLSTKVFDADHHLVGIDAGSFTLAVQVDFGDPEDPDDDVIVEGPLTEHGIRTLPQADFCESLLDLIG